MLPLVLFTTFIVLFVIHFGLKEWRIYRSYGHIPGPRGLPIIGNLHQVDRLNPWITISDMAKTYGPVFKLHFLGDVMIFCNTFNTVKEVLETRGKEFSGRERGFRSQFVTKNNGFIRLDALDDRWKLARKTIHGSIKAFGPGLSRIEHFATQLSEEFIQTFKATNKQPTDPYQTIVNTTLGMISLMVYGRKLSQDSEIFKKLKDITMMTNETFHVGKDGAQLDHLPWLRFFGANETFQTLKKVKKLYFSIWDWYVNEVAAEDDTETDDSLGKPFMKVMRDHNKKSPPTERFSDEDMRANSIGLMFAGILTTATTLYILILVLLHHPRVRNKLAKEIEEVLGNRTATLKDKSKMPYTHAVITETLRYMMPGPLGIPRRTIVDTEVGGYHVPRNSKVMTNYYLIHNDEETYGDPRVFRPERFLDDDGQLLPADHPVMRATIPFGLGPKDCAGRLFAQYRLFLWTVTLYQRFNIIEDPNGILPTDNIKDMDMVGITLVPKPFKVIFQPKYEVEAN